MPIDNNVKFKARRRKSPLILVTNDDGIYSKGIRVLARCLKGLGDVFVVAPSEERSAVSHSLTLHKPLRIERISPRFFMIDGTPTDCINLGINEILKEKPDVIVSGINKGPNLGDDIHYSGTVSAAIEGGIMGIPSVSVSLAGNSGFRFGPAADFSKRLVKKVLKEGLPAGVILNVNVPNIPASKIKGYMFTIQGRRSYGDIIVEKVDPRGKKYYWIGGDELGYDYIKGSDCVAVDNGYISITPLRVNMTERGFLKKLKSWRF